MKDRLKKQQMRELERAFHKTHFGPEETEEQVQSELNRIRS